jgi:membrane-bound ClpP family serine protease
LGFLKKYIRQAVEFLRPAECTAINRRAIAASAGAFVAMAACPAFPFRSRLAA